ncbi:MAG: hypothetical protein RL662_1613 [Bacteroidota bacterium]
MFKQFCAIVTVTLAFIGCSSKNAKTDTTVHGKASATSNNDIYMLVGTYTSGTSKGIYVYKLDTVNGTSEYISDVAVNNPSYLVLNKAENQVYAVTEDDTAETSAVNAFSFDKGSGKLTFVNQELTNGGAPCFINIDDNNTHIVTANYVGGNISIFPIKQDGSLDKVSQLISFTGKGLDVKRQTQPHIHCVTYTPDGNYLLANDLGTDNIHKLKVDNTNNTYLSTSESPESFSLKPGSGPRHLAFHPSGKYAYLLTELSGDVVVFHYKQGNLTEIQTITADSLHARGSADIHVSPDGKYVYASNRVQGDGIAIFSINEADGKLTKVGYQPTGKHPRNFAITPNGNLFLVANRDSNNIQVFKRNSDTGLLEDMRQSIAIDKPVCIKFASINE